MNGSDGRDAVERSVCGQSHGRQPSCQSLRIQRDQRTDERAIVANNYRMLHNRTFHDLLFHRNRGDVLAAGSDDDVLLTAGDRNASLVIDRRQIARFQPPILGERFRRLLRQIVVAPEHVWSLDL